MDRELCIDRGPHYSPHVMFLGSMSFRLGTRKRAGPDQKLPLELLGKRLGVQELLPEAHPPRTALGGPERL